MTELKRLFDCLEYHLQNENIDDMLAGKENNKWKKFSTSEVCQLVNDLSTGLLSEGISCGDMTPEGRDKIAVLSKNRPEWLILDLAVQKAGAILTPFYPTINIIELAFVLNETRAKMIFVNDEDLYKKVISIKNELPFLQNIYSFEKADNVKHWKELLTLSTPENLAQVKVISDSIKEDDLATIIYTSGTTGKPKGVMLSHKNILSNVKDSTPCFPPGDKLKALSFLPLNHIFEKMVSYLYLFKGTAIYYAENLETIAENLKEVKPHMFTTVPRLLEKVYEKIMIKGRELTGIKKILFFWAHGLAEKFELNTNQGFSYNIQLALANKLIFSKWRAALGNEIKCIVSGGAACQVRLIKIFTAAKIPIMEGYGLTETSPVISVNGFKEKDRKIGTVGPLIQNVQVKIAEDGEILCKGSNIMKGYYLQPELTAEIMDDGWFKTGDIGLMIDNRFLKITDRKKEIFKTSGGKYVAPLAIENKLKESDYIENVMVVGAGHKFTGALIIPSFTNLKQWCKENNIDSATNEIMTKNNKVIDMYGKIIDGYNLKFNPVEQVKKFELLSSDWSIEAGEMTPKLSLKRKVISEKYQEIINKIYGKNEIS